MSSNHGAESTVGEGIEPSLDECLWRSSRSWTTWSLRLGVARASALGRGPADFDHPGKIPRSGLPH
eukprot:5359827-Alexandrium_andersonii.AAC.1